MYPAWLLLPGEVASSRFSEVIEADHDNFFSNWLFLQKNPARTRRGRDFLSPYFKPRAACQRFGLETDFHCY